ncbi:MAG: protein phosphatase 2C domain-containing protein [Tannerellaceae bacterium]|jgi:protein phosphatase|nr:protein phosphatase 2C domain-containing protein [Tannerellaceae bacterium]
MTNVKFRIAVRCESAGRPNNEDNYQVGANLNEEEWSFTTDEEVELSSRGALLVVADGMGGMNAGEVASALAIDTIKEWFAPSNLTDDTLANSKSIKKHIRGAIQAADQVIKNEGDSDKGKRGMGSTIVLAWLVDKSIYVAWCGDSRAYCFNATDGLVRLSHDHSYVQELVDTGKLNPELAFDHPENNIITRSLGDTRSKANPDIREFPLRNEDIFLLCSDGLCGVLRDAEIENAISENISSPGAIRNALWERSYQAGWDDNVTIVLCQVVSGAENEEEEAEEKLQSDDPGPELIRTESGNTKKKSKFLFILFLLLLLLAGGFSIYQYGNEIREWGISIYHWLFSAPAGQG